MKTPRKTPWRLTFSTLAVALAAGLLQPALAQPVGEHEGHTGAQGAHHMMRMLDSIGATEAQRAQIKAIMLSAHNDLKAVHESGRQLRRQQADLMAKPTIDARAAETLRQQGMALHDQASKRMLQARLDMAAVLSADQRAQLASRMQQRRALMERQHSERQQLDAPAR